MAITLNEITLSVIPFAKLEFDTTQLSSTDEQPFKALLIGESENDFPSGDNPIKVLDQREAEEFGVDSALSEMAIYWLKNVPTIPLYVLPLKKGANALDLKARLQPLQTQSQYNIVVSAYSDQAYLVEIANHLETVGKGDYGKDGLAFASKSGTIRTLSDFIEGKGALGPSPDSPPSEGDDLPSTEPVSPRNPPNRGRNSENSGLVNEENQRLIPINHKNLTILASPEVTIPAIINSQGVVTTPAKKMSDHMRAVVYAGAVAVEAQKDPSRPFHALILKDMLSPLEKDEFSDRDLEALVKMGYSVYQVTYNRDCQLARTVTTNTKNSMGIDDYSFSDINLARCARLRLRLVAFAVEGLCGDISSNDRCHKVFDLFSSSELTLKSLDFSS